MIMRFDDWILVSGLERKENINYSKEIISQNFTVIDTQDQTCRFSNIAGYQLKLNKYIHLGTS